MKPKLLLYILIFIVGCNTTNRSNEYNTNKFGDVDKTIDSTITNFLAIDNDNFTTLKVDDKFEPSNNFSYNEIIDSIWYLPLETNKKSLIENIEKVILHEGNVYVLDVFSNSLLKFDLQGRFITQIGEEGKGPNEYVSPMDFEIVNKEILILDDRAGVVKYYDLDGKFLKDEKLSFRMNQFIFTKENRFLCNIATRGNFHIPQISDFKLISCQPDWKIFGKGDEYNAELESNQSFSRKVLTKSGENIIYNPSFDYFIYEIESGILKKKYYVDVGKNKLPEGINNLTSEEFIQTCLSRDCNIMFMFHSVFETDKHLVATLHYNGYDIPLYYSKNSGNLICNKHYKFSSKFPFGFIVPRAIINNTLIGYMEPYMAIRKIKELREMPDLYEKIPERVKKLVNNLKEDDNPLLVFFTLKDF